MPADSAAAAQSLAHCRAAIERDPADIAAWNRLGAILRPTDPIAAEGAWRRAAVLAPDNAEARFNLGNICRERGDPRAALSEYELALESAPDHAGTLNNLALVLEALGDIDRAEACYRRVLAANPRHPDSLGNLASLLFEREAFRQSSAAYEQLFAVRRDTPAPVWVRRALAYQRTGDLAAAEDCFREAARLLPDDVTIQLNVGTVCSEQQRWAEAESAWLRALEFGPENPYALSMLAHGRQHRCDWRGLAELHAAVVRSIETDRADDDSKVNPFTLLSMPTTPEAQLRAARRWATGLAPASPATRPTVALAAGERLRIGFVSSDFRAHPSAHLCMEFWERIDRDRFETFAYGIREADPGPIGQRCARAFDHFVDVSATPDREIVRRIRADRIAVLFDLNGYTKHSRQAIFAHRPAPVQVNAFGYPGTLGADWYDYIVVDHYGAPDAAQRCYVERLLHMPHASFPSDTRRAPNDPPPTRAECGLPVDAFVFCCFNNAYKILPDVFDVWMRLLHAVPGSVLWFVKPHQDAAGNLRREAVAAGVDADRLIFALPMASVEQHVARIACADLFLDSYPYGAHTTANDALLAGLPLITRAGATLASRLAGSQLHAIGMSELVTSNSADYEALARRLAQDPGELAALRARLGANRKTHPLFDMARYTRDFEENVRRVARELADPRAGTRGPIG